MPSTASFGVALASASDPVQASLVPSGQPPSRHQRVDERVLGREHHEGRAEERVGAGGEDLDAVLLARAGDDGEGDPGALGPADPVALHELDLLGPVDAVEVVGQPVGVRGDAHHPLAQVARKTGKLPRSERPSLVTSSLESTVPRPGHQLTGASDV